MPEAERDATRAAYKEETEKENQLILDKCDVVDGKINKEGLTKAIVWRILVYKAEEKQ